MFGGYSTIIIVRIGNFFGSYSNSFCGGIWCFFRLLVFAWRVGFRVLTALQRLEIPASCLEFEGGSKLWV